MISDRRIFITGSAGFIGFHLAKHLLEQGCKVFGYDNHSDYYDVALKKSRVKILESYPDFDHCIGDLVDADLLNQQVEMFKPDVVIHLAAQAGVRYSLENPRSYVDTNVVGSFNVMEAARLYKISHLLMASTSSIYGANVKVPFQEIDPADQPLTIYAATKKASEVMAHSYAHLWNIPTTMFRFFTVYGPWGRPDMAYYKFAKAIMNDEAIDVYNHGEMERDFTYVDDLVKGIALLVECPPALPNARMETFVNDSISPIAPHRIVNIGNSDKIRLMDFIEGLEKSLGREAKKNFMDMQKGDVSATWADTSLLQSLTEYSPSTHFTDGLDAFAEWYKDYIK